MDYGVYLRLDGHVFKAGGGEQRLEDAVEAELSRLVVVVIVQIQI